VKFKYAKYKISSNEAFPRQVSVIKPVIPVRITYGEKSVTYDMLIDSGADYCLSHATLGEQALGLNVKSGKIVELGGIKEGKITAYFHDVILEIGGAWKVESYVGFSYDIEHMPVGLLGSYGFFDKFDVKLEFTREMIEIKLRN